MKPVVRGDLLVEFVRLIMVCLFAVAGWYVAESTDPRTSGGLLLGIIVGSGIGFVLGGILGRRTASAVSDVERQLRRVPAPEVLAGTIGLLLGLIVAALLSVPLFRLPAVAAYSSVAFFYVTVGYVGYRIGKAKAEELLSLFGVKPKAAGARPGDVSVLDSSALLDGRVMALVEMGFFPGTLLVPGSVVEELQTVADSADPGRRARGRRALDLLVQLTRDPSVEMTLVDEERRGGEPVDVQLVRIAKSRGGALITNDTNLAKVAAALEVPVRSIAALADALRPQVMPGERVPLRLTRHGRESGQAVGYLDDGTMVVVEGADHLLGQTVSVAITNALQTSAGRMVFARLADARSKDPVEHGESRSVLRS
ncbi:MAG TPA: TRAM domain-containing protein [Actinomycetota bacterium]|nr:TRAM domain-containing protein [Actinomycetota bacterium]